MYSWFEPSYLKPYLLAISAVVPAMMGTNFGATCQEVCRLVFSSWDIKSGIGVGQDLLHGRLLYNSKCEKWEQKLTEILSFVRTDDNQCMLVQVFSGCN